MIAFFPFQVGEEGGFTGLITCKMSGLMAEMIFAEKLTGN